jgi:hypothetical protein
LLARWRAAVDQGWCSGGQEQELRPGFLLFTGAFRRRPESMLKANHRQKGVWIEADMDSGRHRNDTEKG